MMFRSSSCLFVLILFEWCFFCLQYLQYNAGEPVARYNFTVPRVLERFIGTIYYYLTQQMSTFSVPVIDPTGFKSYGFDELRSPPSDRMIFLLNNPDSSQFPGMLLYIFLHVE